MAGLAAAFGSGAMTNSVQEIEDADCIFIIGSNTTSSHPLIATRVYRAKEKGAKVIVADPRRIHIADIADVAVQQNLGTDVALLNGMMKVILDNNWQDQTFINERTEGFEEFTKAVQGFSVEKAAELTGISTEDITAMAEIYAKSDKASILYCMGITQHTTGVDNVKALANLAMLTGNLGKESAGVNPLRGQNNVQGACDMGGLPNVFTGYQKVTDEALHDKMSKAWSSGKFPSRVGLTIPEMISGIEEGSVHGLYVLGENPVVSDPDSNHVTKALEKIDFLVVQDIFLTPTAELADVVLPGASFAEKDGTFTNTERRVMRVRKAIDPPGEAKPDWEIIQELSSKFGYAMHYESPREIMEEIAAVTPSYGGISYARLEGPGLQWPCPDQGHPGTPYLHKDKFARGKGLFHAVEFIPPAESIDDDYPLWLTTGRNFSHYHTGTMTRLSPTLVCEYSENFMEVSPEDARELDLSQGEQVSVASRRGEIGVRVQITPRLKKGTVFIPFHYVESNVNKLTNPAMDPIARIPEYKVCAVKVEKNP
ncbi:MAG: formate dehydrogenase subunit alpha [Desulfohalobiaceae bacterium]|nr:formate dehydrogenase subunit alpha [Desulfohalobiaceae bacterium]